MDAKRVEGKLRLTKQENYGGRACKPDSVPRTNRKPACARGDHSSSPGIATGIQQPTRGFSIYDGLRLRRTSAFIFMNADSVSRPGSPLPFSLAPPRFLPPPPLA